MASRVTLADLCNPPDTAALVACDDTDTALAIERMRRKLLRQRKRLLPNPAPGTGLDAIIARLRRLQNPQLTAYRNGDDIQLSEPFNGIPSAIERAGAAQVQTAVAAMMGVQPPQALVETLAAYGQAALSAAVQRGVSIALVPDGEPFASFSSSVARCAPAIDEWASPPPGVL